MDWMQKGLTALSDHPNSDMAKAAQSLADHLFPAQTD
jgi:hypothetical protein